MTAFPLCSAPVSCGGIPGSISPTDVLHKAWIAEICTGLVAGPNVFFKAEVDGRIFNIPRHELQRIPVGLSLTDISLRAALFPGGVVFKGLRPEALPGSLKEEFRTLFNRRPQRL